MNKRTIDAYNVLAKEYDEETADFWKRFPPTFINKFAELAKGKVLDVGCGPGRDGLFQRSFNIVPDWLVRGQSDVY